MYIIDQSTCAMVTDLEYYISCDFKERDSFLLDLLAN